MLVRYFLVIFVFPITLFAQTASLSQIRNEDDMLSALVSLPTEKGTTASSLFLDHRDLVSRSLFDKLVSQADRMSESDANKSFHIYEIAREAAEQLRDR